MRISDLHILITGGASGIGRVLTERLYSEAAGVAVLDLNDPSDDLRLACPDVKWLRCDVGDPDSVSLVLNQLDDIGFRCDVVVNNAGVIYNAPLINMLSRESRLHSISEWRRVMAANLDSVFYVTREAVDRMLQQRRKGVVINISSISANGNAGQTAYSASKAGVNALTKTWAKELGAMGVRFAAIAPGFLDTPSTRAALSQSAIDSLKQRIPLRRLGDPEQILQAVRFIIENDYVNGTVLEIDGGLVI